MEQQTEIYDPKQILKRERRARSELVEEAALRPALKTVLAALRHFTGDNPHCWPKQETLATFCGYGPKSIRALQKKLYELQQLGIISIENGVHNGARRSSFYTINWDRLATFCDCPPAIPEPRTEPEEVAPLSRPIGRIKSRPIGRIMIRSSGRIYTTSRNYQRTDNDEGNANSFGVVGLGNKGSEKKPVEKRSGDWAGFIAPAFPREERARLFAAAVAAGYLTDCPVDRVRFVALTLHAKTRPEGMVTGFFVSRIERGDWGYLDQKHITAALNTLRPLGISLTPDEVREVRMPRMAVR